MPTDKRYAVALNEAQSELLDRFVVRLVSYRGHMMTRGAALAWAMERGLEFIEAEAAKAAEKTPA